MLRNLLFCISFLSTWCHGAAQVNQSFITQSKREDFVWRHVSDFKIANKDEVAYINQLKDTISKVKKEVDRLVKNERKGLEKDPFETTETYLSRRAKIIDRLNEVKNEKLGPLQEQLLTADKLFVREDSASLNIRLTKEAYNADRAEWKVSIIEKESTASLILSIQPQKARQLWNKKDTWKFYKLSKASDDSTNYIEWFVPNEGFEPGFSIVLEKSISKSDAIGSNDNTDGEDRVFTVVQIPAEFPGGLKAWTDFMGKNIQQEIAVENGAPPGKYTVVVAYVINKTGELGEIKVEKDPGYGCAEEVVRVLKLSPLWKPAVQNGRNVIYKHVQSLTFTVSED